MAPAEIIPQAVQGWCFTLLITLCSTVMVCWLLWKIMVLRRSHFIIRMLICVTLILALLLGFLKTTGMIPFEIDKLHLLATSVPPRITSGWDIQLFQQPIIEAYGRWNWVVYEWKCYGGPYVGAAVALLIVAVWQWIRSLHIRSLTDSYPRNRWPHCLMCLGRSALIAGTFCMITYLLATPSIVKNTEACYQTLIIWLRSPREYEDAMIKTMAEVRAEQNQAAATSQ